MSAAPIDQLEMNLPNARPSPQSTSEARTREARERRFMAAMTATCLVTLALAWAGGALGIASIPLVLGLAILAYITGGGLTALRALAELRSGILSIDLLMITAALGAAAVGAWIEGGILLFLFSLSNTLERFALHRTRRAIEALLDLEPAEAVVRRDGREMRIPTTELFLGDIVIVRPGERIPADGEVVSGASSVDQSPMTGESIPVDKAIGDTVFAGTLNQHGAIEIRVDRPPSDTTLQRIIQMVETAQSEKAESERFTDWFGRRYTIGVFGVAVLVILIPWLLLGEDFSHAFYRAMTVLVVASPCAVVISIPAAILSAIARGARGGVLFKGGAHLERAATIRCAAFDKTGTLTIGRPSLTAVQPAPGVAEQLLLAVAASAESRSEHPLARAIVDAARAAAIPPIECQEMEAVVGKGLRAQLATGVAWVGKRSLLEGQGIEIPSELVGQADALAAEGQTVMYVALEGQALGVVAAADTLRSSAAEAIQDLRAQGIEHLVMLTGDNAAVARAVAGRLGIAYQADLLPGDKLRIVRQLVEKHGGVAMVGDGINDAPSLAAATLGVSLGGSSTDVALETADLVLMGNDLRRLPDAIALARQTNQVIRQNLIFAFSMMALLLLAAFGVSLRLPFAVVGHEGSTVLVILNGLRLLGFRFRT